MINHPPPTSTHWTPDERLNYLTWMLSMTLGQIRLDDPSVPVVAKGPMRALFHAAWAVASWPAVRLEANREALMKPHDPAGMYHSVLMPAAWLDALRKLAAESPPAPDTEFCNTFLGPR